MKGSGPAPRRNRQQRPVRHESNVGPFFRVREGRVLGGQTWDVFISHASEDKDSVARPLREALTRSGITGG